MKEINHNSKSINFLALMGMLLLVVILGCEREDKDLRPATFPNTAEIYIDRFSAGLEYAAFGDSKVTAFTVDENVSYEDVIGTSSMRFDIPNEGDPEGPYAGGVFRDLGGRDLSGYNALTFYAQATKAATVNLIGFGNDFMGDKFSTTTSLKLSTSWTKYIIPIPDPSKLTQEKGLLVIAEGPEDGDGFSMWLDVVQFEQLGTLAHPRPAILNGEDVTSQTFIGVTSTLTGLTYTVNLPNGADQTVDVAPSYYEFTSSDTAVAKINELGVVSVVGQGTAKISATMAGEDAAGSLTIKSLGEFTHAPIPDRDATDVISIFSDAYTNVPVDFYNGFFAPFQTTKGGADIEINGDNIIRYFDLNFVATQFSQPTVNASEMTHVHVDIQVEDQLEGGDFIRIELVDFGPDGSFGGGDDSNGSAIINSPPLETGSWASLDIPLGDFDGLSSTANLAQFFFISDATISNILVDNMYFYKEGGGGGTPMPPTMPATDPTEDSENVISIYSDIYTNVAVEGFNLYGGAAFEEVQIMNNGSLKYTFAEGDGGNFQVIELGGANQIDAETAGMTNFRFDLWFPNAVGGSSAFVMKLVDIPASGATEGQINVGPSSMPEMVQGSWLSFDIPFTELQSNGLGGKSNIQQIVVDLLSSGEVYIDNIYFYKTSGASEPTMAAPTPPSRDAGDVVSIFSDAYTNISGINLNPDWGQGTQVSEVDIAGNNTLLYASFNYQGTDFSAIAQDVSEMQFLHVDMWTVDATDVKVTPINNTGDPKESLQGLTPITTGQWVSYDIPIADYTASGMTLDQVIQLKFDGQAGTTPSNIYLDNIYFYKTGGGASEPTAAAPVPPSRDAADVISLFSNAYANETVDTWSADWDDSEVEDVQIAGDDVKKYTFTNFAGIDFSSNKLDAAGMTNFHMDIWTPDEITDKSFTIKNVDFGGGNAEASNFILTVVQTANGDIPPLAKGSWVSIDVPISAFTGDLTRSDLAQMVLSCNLTTVYIDNIYFYKSGGGSGTEPTTAAPAPPTRDAADVVSIFSDAYTDITGIDRNPGWGQSTQVSEVDIAGDNTLKYATFNYQGTDFSGNSQDISSMQFLHIDMWTADATDVKVTPINGAGSPTESLLGLSPITAGQWVSYDIPLTDFTASGMTLDQVIQMKFDGQAGTTPSNLYLDNIYFYKSGGGSGTEPTTAAPAPPTRDAADVVSIFSDAYTDITGIDRNPGWGQSTQVSEVDIAGDNTLKYATFNFQGTDFSGNSQDISSMQFLHVDMWTADATDVKVTPINGAGSPTESLLGLTPITAGQWVSYDIPLTDFTASGMTLDQVIQMKFDGQAGTTPSNIWVDNIYFYKDSGGSGGGPSEAAPTPPARDAANVVSIYSDAYTNIATDNFDAGWCGGAAVTGVMIGGSNTLMKNTGVDCHGIDFASTRQDLSSFTHIHFDFYTNDTDLIGDVFNVKLVDFAGGGGEASALEVNINTGTVPAIEAGVWVSVDIDITSLGGVVTGSLTRSDIAQIGITTANLTNVWYDNIYLYK